MCTMLNMWLALLAPMALASTLPPYCAPGHYISEQHGCVRCPDHLFQPNANEKSCWTCPYASTPNRDGTLCICDAGTFWNTTVNFCMQCPPGTRTVAGDMFTCHPCPPNTYQPAFGAASCVPCTPGSFAWHGATACTSCARGEWLIDGKCGACAAGETYDARRGVCTRCAHGSGGGGGGGGGGCTRSSSCAPNEAMVDGECGSCDAGSRYDASRQTCVPCGANGYRPTRSVEHSCLHCPPPARPNAERTQCLVCFSNRC